MQLVRLDSIERLRTSHALIQQYVLQIEVTYTKTCKSISYARALCEILDEGHAKTANTALVFDHLVLYLPLDTPRVRYFL